MLRPLVLFGFLALGGCAAAHMRVPAALSEGSARTEITGIGGKPGGSFVAGAYSGRFNRSLERWDFAGEITRKGRSDFVVAGPEISSTIEARCDMRERAVDLGLAEMTVRPLAYRCAFTAEGHSIPARFELQETVGGGSAITRYERHGEIALGGEIVRFRSVHHLAGTSMTALTPVGYVFEQRGQPIGALELTGRPALMLAPALDPGPARTATVAALALATFWDPAIHDLD